MPRMHEAALTRFWYWSQAQCNVIPILVFRHADSDADACIS